jgi:Zn-dependent peptidase ImmA (M78 family)
MKKTIKIRICQDFLYANDIFIRPLPLPGRVKGFCTEQYQKNIICINNNINKYQQEKIFRHELKHILCHDLDSKLPVQYIEFF